MKKTIYALQLLCASVLLAFTAIACTSDEETFEEVSSNEPQDFGNVTVSVTNYPTGENKIASTRSASSDSTVVNLTATCVKMLSNNHAIVSYHGRNGALTGMLQIVKYNDDNSFQVVSELNTQDARVNTVETNGDRHIFVGFDARDTHNAASGVAQLDLNDAYQFEANMTSLTPTGLNGRSINNIIYQPQWAKLWVTTSTYQAATDIKAGLVKFDLKNGAFKIIHNWTNKSLRGHWIDFSENQAAFLYTAEPKTYNSLGWRKPVIRFYSQVLPESSQWSLYADAAARVPYSVDQEVKSKNSCRIYRGSGDTKIFVCTDSMVVYNYADSAMTQAAVVSKATHYVDFNGNTAYAAHGTAGVFKYKVNDDGTLQRLGKYKSNVMTADTTETSANFCLYSNGKLFVAYGYAGLVILGDADFK